MSVLKMPRLWGGLAVEFTPDNDAVTVNRHPSLDDLAANIARAEIDRLEAQTAVADAQDAVQTALVEAERSIAAVERAHLAFIKRCGEIFTIDLPLPGQIQGDQ